MHTAPQFPSHIAVITDGNSRWARIRGMDSSWGHRAGADRVIDIVEECAKNSLAYLTFFAFSSENWSRPEDEVASIMELLVDFLTEKLKDMKENDIRFLSSGGRNNFSKRINKLLDKTIRETSSNKGLTLTLCLDYGGRREIVDAASLFSGGGEEDFENYLYLPDIPDIDLLIRTSGEERISNFMLWQLSYAELYFTETLWPDFDKEALLKAVKSYERRERRFGGRLL